MAASPAQITSPTKVRSPKCPGMRVFLISLCLFPAGITMGLATNIFLKSKSHAKKLSVRPIYAEPDPTLRLSKICCVRETKLRATMQTTTIGLAELLAPLRRRTHTCLPCQENLTVASTSKSREVSATQCHRRTEPCATMAPLFSILSMLGYRSTLVKVASRDNSHNKCSTDPSTSQVLTIKGTSKVIVTRLRLMITNTTM
jgi:hypothetical protein